MVLLRIQCPQNDGLLRQQVLLLYLPLQLCHLMAKTLCFWVQDLGWHLQHQVLLAQALFFMNSGPHLRLFLPSTCCHHGCNCIHGPFLWPTKGNMRVSSLGSSRGTWLDLHQIAYLHLVHIPQVVENHNLFKLQENPLFPKEASHFLHGLLMVHHLQ